jgi:hypothetical protein
MGFIPITMEQTTHRYGVINLHHAHPKTLLTPETSNNILFFKPKQQKINPLQ